ncbi:hypothetical protein M8818_002333 [Zalaria obscura]|uniref:Uncharacterized protein n=1 Tax=Zalaria obscura TaxID=2024903 RepID=A0ACC3SI17_9PEZI
MVWIAQRPMRRSGEPPVEGYAGGCGSEGFPKPCKEDRQASTWRSQRNAERALGYVTSRYTIMLRTCDINDSLAYVLYVKRCDAPRFRFALLYSTRVIRRQPVTASLSMSIHSVFRLT